MYDLIPFNKIFFDSSIVYHDNNNNNIVGPVKILVSSLQSDAKNMFDSNNNTYWESDPLFDSKVDDVLISNSYNDLDFDSCSGPNYLSGTCNNMYTGYSELTSEAQYMSNSLENDIDINYNKVKTTFKGEIITIILPNPHYLFETHIGYEKGFGPKRYFVFAYDEDTKKWILLNTQLNIDYNKDQDILPIHTVKRYSNYKIVFTNLSENTSIRINKLQLRGDVDLSNAPKSKYKYNIENFDNVTKKVSFSDVKYVYEYEDNISNFKNIDYIIPLSILSILFIMVFKKK